MRAKELIIIIIIMYSFMCYFSKLQLIAHYKAKNKTQSQQNFRVHSRTHARTHAPARTRTNARTHTLWRRVGGGTWKTSCTRPSACSWKCFREAGWSAYGLFRAHRCHLELNWSENLTGSAVTYAGTGCSSTCQCLDRLRCIGLHALTK